MKKESIENIMKKAFMLTLKKSALVSAQEKDSATLREARQRIFKRLAEIRKAEQEISALIMRYGENDKDKGGA